MACASNAKIAPRWPKAFATGVTKPSAIKNSRTSGRGSRPQTLAAEPVAARVNEAPKYVDRAGSVGRCSRGSAARATSPPSHRANRCEARRVSIKGLCDRCYRAQRYKDRRDVESARRRAWDRDHREQRYAYKDVYLAEQRGGTCQQCHDGPPGSRICASAAIRPSDTKSSRNSGGPAAKPGISVTASSKVTLPRFRRQLIAMLPAIAPSRFRSRPAFGSRCQSADAAGCSKPRSIRTPLHAPPLSWSTPRVA